MLVHHSFDPRFVNVMERFRKIYGENMFELEGIGEKNLDINRYSKDFFTNDKKKNAADKTIDANANTNDSSVISWENESKKPIIKLNSMYCLWRSAVTKHGIKRANKFVEHEIRGAIRIHDFHMWLKPYSYYQETPIIVRINNGSPLYITMKQLFDMYSEHVSILPDREVIDLENIYKEIYYTDNKPVMYKDKGKLVKQNWDNAKYDIKEIHNIEILDGNNKWTKLRQVLRHKNNNQMVMYQTKNGDYSFVTSDHPVILDNNKEIKAGQLKIGDAVKTGNISYKFNEYIDIPDDVAYFIGFILGDGNVGRHKFYKDNNNLTQSDVAITVSEMESSITIYQTNIKHSKIYQIAKRLFESNLNNRKSVKDSDDRLTFSSRMFKLLLSKYFSLDYQNSSWTKRLPVNILSWMKHSKQSLIAGLFDAEGIINHNNHSIKMTSYSIMNQLYEVFKSINIDCVKSISGQTNWQRLWSISFDPDNDIYNLSTKMQNNGPRLEKNKSHDSVVRNNEVCKIFILDDLTIQKPFEQQNLTDYVYDITTESSTFYCNGMTQHNCYASSLEPVVSQGMPFYDKIKIGPVKHFKSFCNLSLQYICYISNQIAGAIALPDFFVYMDYFIRKDYGEQWYEDSKILENVLQEMQSWIYSVNFCWRSNQSPFTNLSIFDKYWLEALFGQHKNPDFSSPDFENVDRVQKMFVRELVRNQKNNPFTFPVLTAAMLKDKETGKIKDELFFDFVAELTADSGLFNMYIDDNTASLSSCCRLRNNIEEANKEYVNSFGAGGLNIGSHRVVTINLPQIAYESEDWDDFEKLLEYRINVAQDILDIHRSTIQKLIDQGNLPMYQYGYMHLDKQFSTLGFIGMNECLEIMGYDILDKNGSEKAKYILDMMNAMNLKRSKKDGKIRNIEQIPGESAASNLAKKDALLFDEATQYKLYSNQYIPTTKNTSLNNRITAQGRYDVEVGGGSILHINIFDQLTPQQAKRLINYTSKRGVVYFAINYLFHQCETCGKVYIGKYDKSPCHDANMLKYMRVVGFLTKVQDWSEERREENPLRQSYGHEDIKV